MTWRYACNIPTYITGKDENGEPVVLYRVNVFFQQQHEEPKRESLAAPLTDSAPFFVLRRYSQFRHLYDQLKADLPIVMSGRGMAPPSKHPLVLGDKRDALERRRADLERWLWRLVGCAEVARGPHLKAFLELDRALARAQQQQARRRAEHQTSRLLDGGYTGADLPRGSSLSGAPSEASFATASARPNLAYPGGAGGGSAADDSASDASGPSVAPIMGAGSSWTVTGGVMVAGAHHQPSVPTAGEAAGGRSALAPGGGVGGPAVSRDEGGGASRQQQGLLLSGLGHAAEESAPGTGARIAADGEGAGGGGGDVRGPPNGAPAAATSTLLPRLGIHLQNRGDVQRLVDVLVQRLEAAYSESASAASEVSLLREANRDMAARLGELLTLQAAGAEEEVEQLRAALSEAQSARVVAELRATQLADSLAARTAAHSTQVSQLQSQLAESRAEAAELLLRLQDWDVGSSTSAAATTAQLQDQLAEERERAEGLAGQVEAARRQAEEWRERVEVQGRDVEELRLRLGEQERRLKDECKRREQAEAAAQAAAAAPPAPPPPPPPGPSQAQLDRARADNALLAAEVARLRGVVAGEREAHRSALAVQVQRCGGLEGRVRELEGQLAAAQAALQAAEEQERSRLGGHMPAGPGNVMGGQEGGLLDGVGGQGGTSGDGAGLGVQAGRGQPAVGAVTQVAGVEYDLLS